MRPFLSLFMAFSVFISSCPLFADEMARLLGKDFNNKTQEFKIRVISGSLEFKIAGSNEWKTMAPGRHVLEVFTLRERVFYIFRNSTDSAEHVGEIAYRPVVYHPTSRAVAWAGLGVMALGGLSFAMLEKGTQLSAITFNAISLSASVIGGCMVIGGVLAHMVSGVQATVESQQPVCIRPDGNIRYEQAALSRVHRDPSGQIIDVEIALNVMSSSRPRVSSLLELISPIGCDAKLKVVPRYAGIDP